MEGSAFPNWRQYVVAQKRPSTGCIPTGYEILIRAAQCPGVDFESFQDEFDLDKDLRPGIPPRNNFESVAESVRQRYPHIHLVHRSFLKGEGPKKLSLVEERIGRQMPVLVSLSRERLSGPYGGRGWHIMPVVDSSIKRLTLLWAVRSDGTPHTVTLPKRDFVAIHEHCQGGDDVAFLEVPHEYG